MKITDISLKRPVFVTVIFIFLLLVGLLSYVSLPINDMPAADLPIVAVVVVEPGVSAEDISAKVAKNVEDAVAQISGVEHVTTNISESVCTTIIQFSLSKSADIASQEVHDKVSSIRGELPDDIQDPIIMKYDPSAAPILSLAVIGDMDKLALSDFIEENITKKISSINGVGNVSTYGDVEREIQIQLDSTKMAYYGLTTTEVISALKVNNLDVPSGSIENESEEISIRTNSKIQKMEDFSKMLVAKRGGTQIALGDIAQIVDTVKARDSMSLYNGKEAIGLEITKQSGANTVMVAESIQKEVKKLQETLPEGVEVHMAIDNSVPIRNLVDEVVKTILEGCILAILVVFIFLREWESTLISALTLPISIISTFIGLKIMGFSLNTMSLMALSLAVGMLIDDTIVVIENIVRHLHMGKSPVQAAKEATAEIGLAVMATTLAVVAVFVPIAMVQGIVGRYFIEFGITVAISMLVSLFVSFTMAPLMSSRLLKIGHKESKTFVGRFLEKFNTQFDRLATWYGKALRYVLSNRLKTLGLAMILFVGSLALIPQLGFAFMPKVDNGELNVVCELDAGLSLEAALKKAQEVQAAIEQHEEVEYTYISIKKNVIRAHVQTVDKNHRDMSIGEFAQMLRTDMKSIAGISSSVNQSSIVAGMGDYDVTFQITGNDFAALEAFVGRANTLLHSDSHAVDINVNYKIGTPEVSLDVNRDKAEDLSVNPGAAAETIRTLYNGITVGKFDDGSGRYDITVLMNDALRMDLNSLDGILIPSNIGRMVPLSQVTDMVLKTAPAELHRYDRINSIELSCNMTGMPSGDFINMYTEKFTKELDLPEGVQIKQGMANEQMQNGMSSLVIALVLGILFLFMIMAVQFESFIDPIAIMFSLPLALIGGILGLFICRSELSLVSMIGVIMLMGLVAKNAILLIDFAKQRMREGLSCVEALIEAGTIRLRPIIMTSLAMIFGMLPLALAQGAGTELRAPMAQVIIGGLISSTMLTLFIVPVAYTMLDKFKKHKVKE